MDVLDVALAWLPSITDLVVYGSMGTAAAFIYTISFLGIVGTFYRDTSPLLPATRALAAALSMLGPLAVLLMGAFALAESRGLYMVYTFSTARLVGSLCGVPMLLWPAAVALTAYPPFRDAHMPAAGEPAQAAPSDADAAAAAAPLLPGADEPETAAAQPVHEELKEEAAQEAPAAGAKKED